LFFGAFFKESYYILLVLAACVFECIVVPNVAVGYRSTVCDQVADGVKMPFGSRDAKRCTAVVIVCIHVRSENVQGLHEVNVVVVGCVEQPEVVISDCYRWHVSFVLLLLAVMSSKLRQVVYD
jgi:hypothetical protein